MGNCSCLERRAKVTAWDDDVDDDDWGLPAAERSAGRAARRRRVVPSAEDGGGTLIKIRMTKGQLRRLLEMSAAGRGGAPDEDVVAEIMSMGTVRVDVEEFRHAAERHRPAPMPKLATIQEDELDE